MKLVLLAGLLATTCAVVAQQPLFIPDTLSGTSFSLTMHQDSVAFLPGAKTPTLAFNQYAYLGPTLIFRKGDVVNLTVKNEIGDTTTLHWHGLHVPSKWDGGPHTMIMNGDTWNPSFTVMDHAATYWYHPHFHGKTAEQAIKGAAGIILVRDEEEALLNLPRTYGVDDFPVVMQCKQLDSMNRFMPRGMEDSSLFVNGTMNPYLQVPAQVVRLHLLNASGERSFNVGFTNNQSFYVIGTDGGLLPAPVSTTRVPLSPGERAEILLDLSSMNGQQFYLMSYASEFPNTIQGVLLCQCLRENHLWIVRLTELILTSCVSMCNHKLQIQLLLFLLLWLH